MRLEHDPKELAQALEKIREWQVPGYGGLEDPDLVIDDLFETIRAIQDCADDALKSAFLKTTRE